jgi:hypothetical protein
VLIDKILNYLIENSRNFWSVPLKKLKKKFEKPLLSDADQQV